MRRGQTAVDLDFDMQCNAEILWPFTQPRYPQVGLSPE